MLNGSKSRFPACSPRHCSCSLEHLSHLSVHFRWYLRVRFRHIQFHLENCFQVYMQWLKQLDRLKGF